MAITVRELINKIGFDTDLTGLNDADKRIDAFKKRASDAFRGIRNAGLVMSLAITAPVVAFSKNAIKSASDAEETENRFRQVLGNLSGDAEVFAQKLGNAVGRSTIEIKDGIATFQQFGQGLGMAKEDTLKFSEELQSLSLDFASFQNISDAEASQRFISALSGSTEVMDKFGVNLKVAAIEQEALRQGIKKSYNDMTELEKSTLRLDVIRDVMGKNGAIGDAERTSKSFANQLKALNAEFKDLSIQIGQIFLPYAQRLIETIKSSLQRFQELDEQTKMNIIAFVGFAASIGPILFGIGQIGISMIGLSKIFELLILHSAGLKTSLLSTFGTQVITAIRAVGASLWAFATNPATLTIGGITLAVLALTYALVDLFQFINGEKGTFTGKITDWFKGLQTFDFNLGRNISGSESKFLQADPQKFYESEFAKMSKFGVLAAQPKNDIRADTTINVNVATDADPEQIGVRVKEEVESIFTRNLRVSYGDL
jgi:hypothetical protein